MTSIEPLNFSHQSLLEMKFHALNISLSEYSFANLYLFRHLHHYQVIKCKEEVFIKGMTRDHIFFVMPTSPLTKDSIQQLKQIASKGDILFPIPENWLPSLEDLFIQKDFKEEDSDYLFKTLKLAYFPGRHLSKKRNLVKQLFEHCEIKVEAFSHQLDDAQHILENWNQEQDSSNETDFSACQEAIQQFQQLHLHGRIIYANQEPVGFILGEWISKECYVIHFIKANRRIKGLYQFLYQDLAQSIEGTCLWINMEQDLGIPAIRNAKRSYLPDQILLKWRLALPFLHP